MGAYCGEEEEGNLLALLPRSLYSSQDHVVFAKQGRPTMLHCRTQDQAASQANNNAGAWFFHWNGPQRSTE